MVTHKIAWLGSVIAEGRYEVLDQLGEGSMGMVYRVLDRRLETEVVIKVPRGELLEEEFRSRFERETRSLVRLANPHVVKILDVGRHEEVPFVVMQYLGGGSLKSRIRPDESTPQAPQPPESLRDWLLQVAKALDFVHSQQYIHRDVKPANILFDAHGNAFLSDFGLTKVMSEEADRIDSRQLTAAGFLVGTADYVAPEVVMGSECDGRLDQYSLAVTVHEVLTGSVPFIGKTSSAVLVMHTTTRPAALHKLNDKIPEALSLAVLRGLSKDPAKRFKTCMEFAESVIDALPAIRRAESSITGKLPVRTTGSGPLASRGVPGRVPCPKCKRVLTLRPEFAGRRGRCQHCQTPLLISTDIRELRIVVQSSAPASPSRMHARPGSSTNNQAEVELKEKVFGVEISRRTALWVAIGLVVLLLGTSIFVTLYATQAGKVKDDVHFIE